MLSHLRVNLSTAGRLTVELDGTLNLIAMDIVTEAKSEQHGPLSDSDVQKLVSEFEMAKAIMMTVFHQKLRFSTVLPWILVAIGHWDPKVAKRHGKKIMEDFDRTVACNRISTE